MKLRSLAILIAGSTFAATATLPASAAPARGRRRPRHAACRRHAHNDYEHDRPLYDALEHGFTSVEADVSSTATSSWRTTSRK